ncbi:hypothetical protein [Bartonella sp. DGB2]|uniref:glycine-rich domain-containing protein n=1 Tax=Bartonella sp. DGB2 TaxID=3388426 RepID=UPI0039900C63
MPVPKDITAYYTNKKIEDVEQALAERIDATKSELTQKIDAKRRGDGASNLELRQQLAMLKMQLKGLLPPDEEIEIFESKTVLWPAEVTDDSFIEVWAWGGGGSGGKDGSGGGGGGCGVAKYLRKDLPTPLNVIVGKGSNGSFNGGSTFFDRHLFASGGTSGDCPSGGGSGGPILSRDIHRGHFSGDGGEADLNGAGYGRNGLSSIYGGGGGGGGYGYQQGGDGGNSLYGGGGGGATQGGGGGASQFGGRGGKYGSDGEIRGGGGGGGGGRGGNGMVLIKIWY